MPKTRPKAKPPTIAATATAGAPRSAPPLPMPVIVVHGNPASNVLDLYPTTPGRVFTLAPGIAGFPSREQHFDQLPFHPDDPLITFNTTGKTITPARLAAINAFYLPYESLVEAVKAGVGSPDNPAPVFPMAYDWRFDTTVSAAVLDSFVTEVLRICARLPQYIGQAPSQVDVVAHSFGGLVTARYLRACQKAGKPSRVRRVVTIATPFRGAVDALYTMIKDQDQKEAARTLPSVYGLLPYYDGACVNVVGGQQPPPNVDLLEDGTAWNGSSVVRSLQRYCAVMRSQKTGVERFEELRAAAQAQRDDIAALSTQAVLGSVDDWLPIVGIGSETNVRAEIVSVQPGDLDAEFDFVKANQGEDSGDNTVPFLGAIPPFNLQTGAGGSATPKSRLVCLSTDDIDLSERFNWFGGAQGLGLTSLHSFMPQMNAVQAIVNGFLSGGTSRFKVKARPAPGVQPNQVTWADKWNLQVRG